MVTRFLEGHIRFAKKLINQTTKKACGRGPVAITAKSS